MIVKKKRTGPRGLLWKLDSDYLDKLSQADYDWYMTNIVDQYYLGDFREPHDITIEEQRKLGVLKHAARRDIYSRNSAMYDNDGTAPGVSAAELVEADDHLAKLLDIYNAAYETNKWNKATKLAKKEIVKYVKEKYS